MLMTILNNMPKVFFNTVIAKDQIMLFYLLEWSILQNQKKWSLKLKILGERPGAKRDTSELTSLTLMKIAVITSNKVWFQKFLKFIQS